MKWLDWARLTALREDIGEECFADVALMFVAEINEHLGRLLASPDQADAADFHFLRGSAANMGFAALAEACKTAEEACKTGEAPNLQLLDTAFRRALEELSNTLPDIVIAA